MSPSRTPSSPAWRVRSWTALCRLAVVLACAALPAGVHAGLVERSFLPLAAPPPNWLPTSASDVACGVAARGDGLVAVGGWTRQSVFLVDARDASAPRLVCEFRLSADICGMAFEGDSLWVGGDDAAASVNGLIRLDLPADPFNDCFTGASAVPGVLSGVSPNVFSHAGRPHALVVNRWGYPNRVVDLDASTAVGEWIPADPNALMADSTVTTLADGRRLAAVAAQKTGAYVLDLADPSSPRVLARFDWTYSAPDVDGNPATPDGCDRNGDGDWLECGESGRNGDGRRLNFAVQAAIAEVGGVAYLLTIDGNLGGSLRVWALDDVLAFCAGEANSNCPVDAELNNASGPPWPGVDAVPLAAFFQRDACPLAPAGMFVSGDVVFVAYHEDGVHAIDLAAQGLPASAVGGRPFEMTELAWLDTMPGDSDTVLENYPCHVLGVADGCESQNADWNPTPCQPSPPGDAAFRVVRNAGLRGVTAVDWTGCRLYVADQGTPDGDGLPAPEHEGLPPGLRILEFEPLPDVTGASLRVRRDAAMPQALELTWEAGARGVVREHRVHRGTLPILARGYDHECVARSTGGSVLLQDQVLPASTSHYYLVGCACDGSASDVGADSLGMPILPSPAPCP